MIMPSIKGLQKTSLVDFTPYIACTVFFSGCNFRCGFCHNKDLVVDSKNLKEYSEDEILEFLDKRKNVLDGVCLTGGEPLLYDNIKDFISKIKNKGFKVKLDTNGSNPK
jgi:pyruvate formate lyase activating enzyme